ncbi:MAG: DEAD/DEAH box helicase [Candidatus Micrarchaeia archaeon]
MKKFSDMNLKKELLENLTKIKFTQATEVQEEAIPVAMEGKDIIVRSKTGTGKTAAFLVPIIQKLGDAKEPAALIIAPTRELAIQITEMAMKLMNDGYKKVAIVYGGASINVQIQNLRRNPAIIVGTPGRILDLIERGALDISKIRFLTLDEADTMLDMGFIDDIKEIMSKTPPSKQTMLFSATMPERIIKIAKEYMHDPKYISVGEEEEQVVPKIKHYYAIAEKRMKFATLLAFINEYNPKKAIIFTNTKWMANSLYEAMKAQGLDVMIMHGGQSQAQRENSLSVFKGERRFLISTNVVARGIDIRDITDIINYDIPEDTRLYLHRVGRTARMEADGRAFTIITSEETSIINQIMIEDRIEIDMIRLNAAKFASARLFMQARKSTYEKGRQTRPTFHGRSRNNEGNNRGNASYGNRRPWRHDQRERGQRRRYFESVQH